MTKRINIPDVIERFKAYRASHGAWGSLHIVCDDFNVDDVSVNFCIQLAEDQDDLEGRELALILLQMSKTQRRKLANQS